MKGGTDPFMTVTQISLFSGGIALCCLPLAKVPAADVWPWLVASAAIHTLYRFMLIGAYRAGDMAQVYPIMRGAAPMMTALATALFIGQRVSAMGFTAIAALSIGVFLMSLRGSRVGDSKDDGGNGAAVSGFHLPLHPGRRHRRRVNDAGPGYAPWMFVLDAATMQSSALAMRGSKHRTDPKINQLHPCRTGDTIASNADLSARSLGQFQELDADLIWRAEKGKSHTVTRQNWPFLKLCAQLLETRNLSFDIVGFDGEVLQPQVSGRVARTQGFASAGIGNAQEQPTLSSVAADEAIAELACLVTDDLVVERLRPPFGRFARVDGLNVNMVDAMRHHFAPSCQRDYSGAEGAEATFSPGSRLQNWTSGSRTI